MMKINDNLLTTCLAIPIDNASKQKIYIKQEEDEEADLEPIRRRRSTAFPRHLLRKVS